MQTTTNNKNITMNYPILDNSYNKISERSELNKEKEKEYEETLENYENFYFKIKDFKEQISFQMEENTNLLEDYLKKSEIFSKFFLKFKQIERNKTLIKESKFKYKLNINYI